jgi:hypothetical protein
VKNMNGKISTKVHDKAAYSDHSNSHPSTNPRTRGRVNRQLTSGTRLVNEVSSECSCSEEDDRSCTSTVKTSIVIWTKGTARHLGPSYLPLQALNSGRYGITDSSQILI